MLSRHGAVTEFLPDTPAVARPYCPVCEPSADPAREILDVRWCSTHTPESGGLLDAAVRAEAYLSGSAEAGGDDNRRWCQLFHDTDAARRCRERATRRSALVSVPTPHAPRP